MKIPVALQLVFKVLLDSAVAEAYAVRYFDTGGPQYELLGSSVVRYAEAEVRSSIPHCASLTGARFNDP